MASREIWVISDTHFGHNNIIRYCNRPFKTVEEMDEFIADKWNETVKPGDIVYHLGDVYFGKAQKDWGSFFGRLTGRKRLLLGNHDDGKDKVLQNTFQKISMWRMFPEFGLLLTHVPVHLSTLGILVADNYEEGNCGTKKRRLKNIHGHTHQNGEPEGDTQNYKSVCVELTNYTPINIEELRVDGQS